MTANRPIEVWEAALGRHVVLIEARTWFEARDVARTMLGGEPEPPHTTESTVGPVPDHRLWCFDKPTAWYMERLEVPWVMRFQGRRQYGPLL